MNLLVYCCMIPWCCRLRDLQTSKFQSARPKMPYDTLMPDAPSTTALSFPHLILPGELLSTILSPPLKLGPGLRHTSSTKGDTLIHATQAGLLHRAKQTEYYVDY